jgi:hypothetical protein
MAARLRLQHQREGAVGVDVDRFDRVHLDRDAKASGHGRSRSDRARRFHVRVQHQAVLERWEGAGSALHAVAQPAGQADADRRALELQPIA